MILDRLKSGWPPNWRECARPAWTRGFRRCSRARGDRRGIPLLFDLTADARCLYDRGGFFARGLGQVAARLAALRARRIWRGNPWVWDLKPDMQPGEVFEL